MAVGQQADVRAATRLSILVVLTGMAPHWGRGGELVRAGQDPSQPPCPGLEKAF